MLSTVASLGLFFFSVNYLYFSKFTKQIPDGEIVLKFEKFIRDYNRSYQTGSEEYFRRFKIFMKSLDRHNTLNSDANGNARFGITEFSDLTPQEYQTYLSTASMRNVSSSRSNKPFNKIINKSNLPSFLDWRQNGKVTPVEDQQQCGACWAFAVTETIESMYAIKYGSLLDLSVQQVINCAEGENKCKGGSICHTAEWLQNDRIRLTTEAEYPLTDTEGDCNLHPTRGIQVSDHSCDNLVNREFDVLVPLLNEGPVAALVDATLWQDYLGGIIQHHCYPDDLTHAVEIVGYNMTGPVPFYIARNSWGTDFGHDGYIYIEIGKNMCGIAEQIVSLSVV